MSAHAYLFIPGRTPLLALQELRAMLPQADIKDLGVVFLVSSEKELDAHSLISELGGTVKIASVRTRTGDITEKELVPLLTPISSEGRITFGISWYGDLPAKEELLHGVKNSLAEAGISSRYVAGHGREPLSSVVISKEHVTELVIASDGGDYVVAVTEAVQDFEGWSKRDRGRRFADAKAGMLPVKVARMVVNIAIGSEASGKTLLDPFCGMGTILNEAYLRGAKAWGSDVSPEAVKKAKENARGIVESASVTGRPEPEFFVADATHVSENIQPASIDAIVTEPYMGPTSLGDTRNSGNVSPEKIKNVLKGLGKLYIGALNEWRTILKPGGIVIIAIPVYSFGGREFSVKNVIDRCENFGYTKIVGPIEYSRPQATVRRNFYILNLAEIKN